MSSHIIYQLQVVRLPAASGPSQDLFALCLQNGSSNSYEGSGANARRSRSWGMIYAGTAEDLVAYAIDWAGAVRSGGTYWTSMGRSGSMTAQQWIRKIRSAIANAVSVDTAYMNEISVCVGPLIIHGKGEYGGQTINQLVESIRTLGMESPGTTMWQVMRVSGPDK